jgi:hypothetical protein
MDRIDAKLQEMELIGKSLRKIKVQRHVENPRTGRGMFPNNLLHSLCHGHVLVVHMCGCCFIIFLFTL